MNYFKHKKTAQFILGVVYPILTLSLGVGYFLAAYSTLPKQISVLFDITRVPITAVPTPIFGATMATVIIISSLICIFVAKSQKTSRFLGYQKIAGYGGFFAVTASFLMVGATKIHRGLEQWSDATGPGWWLLLVIFLGFSGALGAKKLAMIIHKFDTAD